MSKENNMKEPISKETNKKKYMNLYYGALLFFVLNLIFKNTALFFIGAGFLLLGLYRKHFLSKKAI